MRSHTNIHGQPYRIKGQKPGPKNKVRKEVGSFRLYPATIEQIRKAAQLNGETVSLFIEKSVLDRLCMTQSVE